MLVSVLIKSNKVDLKFLLFQVYRKFTPCKKVSQFLYTFKIKCLYTTSILVFISLQLLYCNKETLRTPLSPECGAKVEEFCSRPEFLCLSAIN